MSLDIIIRFLLAVLWGGLVGAEREYRSKSAGFRTMIMISVGSCFFTMMSQYIGFGNNPDRIASNIVTGVGFLGAGVIFRGENRINGITTAASIWAVAAIGMGIGSGHYYETACAAILILLVLTVLPYVERVIDNLNQTKEYTIQNQLPEETTGDIEKLLQQYHLKWKLVKQVKEGNILTNTWQVRGHAKNHKHFMESLLQDKRVLKMEY